jgi:hypothetical protein
MHLLLLLFKDYVQNYWMKTLGIVEGWKIFTTGQGLIYLEENGQTSPFELLQF